MRTLSQERGFFGCSTILIIVWILFILVFWKVMVLRKSLFYLPEEQVAGTLTSPSAARRCEEKINALREADYIRSITLTEVEINSGLEKEFSSREKKRDVLVSLRVELLPNKVNLEGKVYLFRILIPDTIRGIFKMDARPDDLGNRLALLTFETTPEITEPGTLLLKPHMVVVGKQPIYQWVADWVMRLKPEIFVYPISKKIKEIRVEEGQLTLSK